MGVHGGDYFGVGGDACELVFCGCLVFGVVNVGVAGRLQEHEGFDDFSGCLIRVQHDSLLRFKEEVDKLS